MEQKLDGEDSLDISFHWWFSASWREWLLKMFTGSYIFFITLYFTAASRLV
jgi:hypothetical protein